MDMLAVVRRVLGSDADQLAGEAVLDLVVNGVSLVDRWREATDGDEAVPLSSTDAARHWGPDFGALTRAGHRVPVLRCTCGDIGCGGAVLDVATAATTITWSALVPANGFDATLVGPFTFDRDALATALTTALTTG